MPPACCAKALARAPGRRGSRAPAAPDGLAPVRARPAARGRRSGLNSPLELRPWRAGSLTVQSGVQPPREAHQADQRLRVAALIDRRWQFVERPPDHLDALILLAVRARLVELC